MVNSGARGPECQHRLLVLARRLSEAGPPRVCSGALALSLRTGLALAALAALYAVALAQTVLLTPGPEAAEGICRCILASNATGADLVD